jgi:hypothetical protein
MVHAGARTDTSVNYGIVAAGLLVPIALGIAIILATSGRRPSPPAMEMTSTYPKPAYRVPSVPFPPQEQPLPPRAEPAVFDQFDGVYAA